MRYRVQFLDASAQVIRELFADARSAAGVVELVAEMDWPPHAVSIRVFDADRHGADMGWPAHAISIRVLDADGREVHLAIKGGDARR